MTVHLFLQSHPNQTLYNKRVLVWINTMSQLSAKIHDIFSYLQFWLQFVSMLKESLTYSITPLNALSPWITTLCLLSSMLHTSSCGFWLMWDLGGFGIWQRRIGVRWSSPLDRSTRKRSIWRNSTVAYSKSLSGSPQFRLENE